jgi:hypothetical protein
LNKVRWAGAALAVVIAVYGVASYFEEDFMAAQAATDRETVDCLSYRLTHDEKLRIARLMAAHDTENMRPVYTGALERCVVRADQWDRRAQIVSSARQALAHDAEFRRLLGASTIELAQGQ